MIKGHRIGTRISWVSGFVLTALLLLGTSAATAESGGVGTKPLQAVADDNPERKPKRSLAAKAEPRPQWSPRSKQEKKLAKSLSARLAFSFDAQSLEETLNFLEMVSGAEFVVDLERDARTRALNTEVTFALSGVELANALALLLRSIDLTYTIRDGRVVVTTTKQLRDRDVRAYHTSEEFLEKLKTKRVDLHSVGDAPPREIFQAIAVGTGIPIVIDERALAQAEIVLDHRTAHAGPMLPYHGLEGIQKYEHVVAVPRFGVIYVTTPLAVSQSLPWDGPAQFEDSPELDEPFQKRKQSRRAK